MRSLSIDRGLPFYAEKRGLRSPSFRILRFWRSLARLQRNVVLLLIILSLCALIYTLLNEGMLRKNVDKRFKHSDAFTANLQIDLNATNLENAEDGKEKDDLIDKNELVEVRIEGEDNQKANIPRPPFLNFKGPQNERQEAVANAFKHAWKGYKNYAWGHDMLRPNSKKYSEWFNLGLTIVDSIDTIIIMGLREEYEEAKNWVKESLNFERSGFVSFFETTIRVLGGLLSAYHLSGEEIFKSHAIDVGSRLMYAYKSASPVPHSDVNLHTGIAQHPTWGDESSLSEVTTVQLEFRDLSRLAGNSTFEELSFGTSKHIHKIGCKEHDGLCGMYISPKTGQFRASSTITLGARADSYYEYLLKQWLQTGKTIDWLRNDYNATVSAMKAHLLRYSFPNKYAYFGEIHPGGTFSPKMDHLACFIAGSLALGAMNGLPKDHLDLAKEIGSTCQKMYENPSGLGPEIVYFNELPGGNKDLYIKPLDSHCLLRPEAIEGWFYLYRATGDKMYQDWGWKAFQAIETHAKVSSGGYSSVNNVKRLPVTHRDLMDSFFLSETLKYLYLLFSDDQTEIPLHKYVFNSEGHPLPIYRY